ncbi:hypothetical protein F4Z99_09550 [Candidatus Poribacteria bacterium]|nr:hypothetical protein [Candidatus Poribacteria bacterium]MYA98091.1 hypothetical protein [Candidatus Poribacteria bacterium]
MPFHQRGECLTRYNLSSPIYTLSMDLPISWPPMRDLHLVSHKRIPNIVMTGTRDSQLSINNRVCF